jgi:hypothetical protein
MSRTSVLLAALLLVTGACAKKVVTADSAPSSDAAMASPDAAPASARGGGRNVIGIEDIRKAGGGNALDLIRSLRPMWIQKRGPQSLHYEGEVVVYMDKARLGGMQALRDISVSSLTSLQFLDVAAANYKFGPGHPYGAIVLSTSNASR